MPAYKDKAKGTWYASFYYEDWTGKKSIKTTQDIYGHLFDEVQKTIANDLDSLRRR